MSQVKKYFFLIILFACILPSVVLASTGGSIFRAEVREVLEDKEMVREDGSISYQQRLRLEVLEGDKKGEVVEFDGTEYDVFSSSLYEIGDKVYVREELKVEGDVVYYVTGFVRYQYLYYLFALFALIILLIGRAKGLRSLVVLFLTFFIILKFIIPRILAGDSPLLISIVGSLFILLIAIYITEGFNRSSTVAVGAIALSLTLTGLISVFFTSLTKLSGYPAEEMMYLSGVLDKAIDPSGLLLAGIIIGSLGVLDDVVISQVAIVNELKNSNRDMSNKEIYKRAMSVGVSHLSSMVNTLFLAYAGASLALLVLFSVPTSEAMSFGEIINNEVLAVEIVRTLAGSIGLALAIPISTLMAVRACSYRHSERSANGAKNLSRM